MYIKLKNGVILSTTKEKGEQIISILIDSNINEDYEIAGKTRTIKKGEIEVIKNGDEFYTSSGKVTEEVKSKPMTYKVFHSNFQNDFIVVEEAQLDIVLKAIRNGEFFTFPSGLFKPVKVLPNINAYFGWYDDYIPQGEYLRDAKQIEAKYNGVIQEKLKQIINGVHNKRLN